MNFIDEALVEQALVRIERIARKGYSQGRYTFHSHEVKESLAQLVSDLRVRDTNWSPYNFT